MKDLYIIAHQRGEDPTWYYSSLQNSIGDVLAETAEYTSAATAETQADRMVGLLRECANGKRSASPYYCAGWYYYVLLENGAIILRTRSGKKQADADAVWQELLECARGEITYYAHLKEKESLTLHLDPKVMSYMDSLDGQGTSNLLNYTTDVQWENPDSWLWDPEKGELRSLYYKLFHRMPRRRGAEYTVTIRTGFGEHAGTDAQVYLTLYGKRTELTGSVTETVSREFKLESDRYDFDPLGIDEFRLEADEDLGTLEKIHIRHDNTDQGGDDASWYLMDVTVQKSGTKQKWVFPCNKWLQAGESNDVTLTTAAAGYHRDIYYVEVRPRHNELTEGEDSNIYLTFYGTKGKSGEYKLDTTLRKLQGNAEGVNFYVTTDVGDMEKLLLRLDNPKACPEWHLREILVDNMSGGGSWYFPFDRVVPDDDVDSEKGLRYMLVAGHYEDDEIVYAVRVRTGVRFNSGTAARVYVTLQGNRGASQEYKLQSPDNDFQRGALDTFRVSMKEDIGDLQEIRIRHDNFGLWPGWYLERVQIEKLDSPDLWQFPCGRWLAKRKEDGKIERTLPALLPGQEHYKYTIRVRTGDVKGAATFADVLISLYGENGSLEDLELDEFGFDFRRGQSSAFSIELARDLGELKSIRIRHDNTDLFAPWYLEDITVTRTGGGAESQSRYFLCNGWLSKEEGLERTLEPVPCRTGTMVYEISLRTGDVARAGTNADVFITLNGTNGSSREYLLDKSGNDFRRGATDTFTVEQSADLGELTSVRIRQDGSGLMPGWYLEDIRIKLRHTEQSWYFPCGRWLAKGEDDGALERTLDAVPEDQMEGGGNA